MLAGRAGYMTPEPNDAYLIDLIERKVPEPLLVKVYQDEVPTTYADYKDKVIRFDNLNRRLNVIAPAQQSKGRFRSFTPRPTTTPPFQVKQEPLNTNRNRPKGKQLWKPQPSTSNPPRQSTSTSTRGMKCYGCGKEGHMIANCPDKKEKKQQLRNLMMKLKPNERDLIEDFLQD